MSPVRIAMVSSRYAPHLGGVETHVYEVARRMAASGLDLTVLTTDLTGELPPVEHDGSITVRRYAAWPRRADLYISPALIRQIREGRYDLVHVQGVNNFLPPMSLRAAQRSGLPTVATFHTGGHSSRMRTMVRGMQWRALRPLLRRARGSGRRLPFRGRGLRPTARSRTGTDPADPQRGRAPPRRRFAPRGHRFTAGVLGGPTRAVQGTPSPDRGDARSPRTGT